MADPIREPLLRDGACSKAAAYCSPLVRHHPFVDGNKRVAWVTMREFIARNGYTWTHGRGGEDEAVRAVEALALSLGRSPSPPWLESCLAEDGATLRRPQSSVGGRWARDRRSERSTSSPGWRTRSTSTTGRRSSPLASASMGGSSNDRGPRNGWASMQARRPGVRRPRWRRALPLALPCVRGRARQPRRTRHRSRARCPLVRAARWGRHRPCRVGCPSPHRCYGVSHTS